MPFLLSSCLAVLLPSLPLSPPSLTSFLSCPFLPPFLLPSFPYFPYFPFLSWPFLPFRFGSVRFPSLPFPSLPFPSLPFPSLPFPSLPSLPSFLPPCVCGSLRGRLSQGRTFGCQLRPWRHPFANSPTLKQHPQARGPTSKIDNPKKQHGKMVLTMA